VKPKERPRLDSEAIPNFLELRQHEFRRILIPRTRVNKDRKDGGPGLLTIPALLLQVGPYFPGNMQYGGHLRKSAARRSSCAWAS
jgi:hypothetical protein